MYSIFHSSHFFKRHLKFQLLAWTCIALSSCQYRWGEDIGALRHSYSLGNITNQSEYPSAPQRLQKSLLEKLERQSRVVIGEPKAEGGTLIEATILDITKSSLEKNELGHNTELQFKVSCLLKVSRNGQAVKVTKLSNSDLLRSSSSYRPLDEHSIYNRAEQTLNEDKALELAIEDLAQRLIQHLASIESQQ
jgi:hypothetical protein